MFRSFLRKRKWILIAVIVLVGVAGVFFYRSRSSQPETVTATVTRESIEETIDVPGEVDATLKAQLKFLAGGKIVSLPVTEGQWVQKGARIASVDARDLQKNLESSLRDYSSTRTDFEQGFDDRKDEAPSDSLSRVANKLQYSLDKSVIAVELRDIAIKNATLVSPINGVITSLPVTTPGVQVLATDVFEIVDPGSVLFEAEVDEVDIARVYEGIQVRIVLDAYPDKTIDAVVTSIGLRARSSSQSSGGTVFPVKVSIPLSAIPTFRLGLNGTMTIILEKKEQALTIPIEASTVRDGKDYVQVLDPANPNKIIEKEISIGIENEEKAEVLSGLNEGDVVVRTK